MQSRDGKEDDIVGVRFVEDVCCSGMEGCWERTAEEREMDGKEELATEGAGICGGRRGGMKSKRYGSKMKNDLERWG
jgi:hypothetical protein